MARMHSSAAVTIHGAFATDDTIESLRDRLARTRPARLRRLKYLCGDWFNHRKSLIQWGLFVLASGLTLISSHFGDLTSSF